MCACLFVLRESVVSSRLVWPPVRTHSVKGGRTSRNVNTVLLFADKEQIILILFPPRGEFSFLHSCIHSFIHHGLTFIIPGCVVSESEKC